MSRILILGDICPDNNYRPLFDNGGFGPFKNSLVEVIKNSKFAIANLECPATTEERPIIKTGPNIKAQPEDLNIIKNSGINAISLANNHILDFGDRGLIETLDQASKRDLKVLGAGLNSQKAAMPLIIEIDNIKTGILAFAEEEFNLASPSKPGACHFDPYISIPAITKLKSICERVIVLYHGGIEHYAYPSPELQKKCRAMIDAGADLVTCQHSHCIGTSESYNNGHIIYGQGNTAFGFRAKDNKWNEGLALDYDLSDGSLNMILLKATPDGVERAEKTEEEQRLKILETESKRCLDDKWLKENWDSFCNKMKSLDLPLLYGYPKFFTRLNRILGNGVINLTKRKKAKLITLELIRCEAHHEVIKTILENEIKWNKEGQGYR